MTSKLNQIGELIHVTIVNDYDPPKKRYFGFNAYVNGTQIVTVLWTPRQLYPHQYPIPPTGKMEVNYHPHFFHMKKGDKLCIEVLDLDFSFISRITRKPANIIKLDSSNEINYMDKLKLDMKRKREFQMMTDSQKIERIVEDLEDSDKNIRTSAIFNLVQIEDSRTIGLLMRSLNHWDPTVRAIAAKKLGESGDSRAVEPLVAALEGEIVKSFYEPNRSRPTSFYENIVAVLGEIGDAKAVEPLIKALRDKSAGKLHVSVKAARALGKIGGARAVEALVKTLKEDARQYTPSEYMEQFTDELSMREEAGKALINIGEPAVIPLIESLDEAKKGWPPLRIVAKVLSEIGDVKAINPLTQVLKKRNLYACDRMVLTKALEKLEGMCK